jgi:hypothetical protein
MPKHSIAFIFPICAIEPEKDFFLTAAGNYVITCNKPQAEMAPAVLWQ